MQDADRTSDPSEPYVPEGRDTVDRPDGKTGGQTGDPEDEATDPAESSPEAAPVARAAATGHPAVDAVLASLEDLDHRPVHEHVALFEHAHEALRLALDDAAAPATPPADNPHTPGPSEGSDTSSQPGPGTETGPVDAGQG